MWVSGRPVGRFRRSPDGERSGWAEIDGVPQPSIPPDAIMSTEIEYPETTSAPAQELPHRSDYVQFCLRLDLLQAKP